MKPNFSGEYVLNRGASTLSPLVAPSVETAIIRIQHNEPTFSCEGRFVFRDQKIVQWAFELATDGGQAQLGRRLRRGCSGMETRWYSAAERKR